MRSRKPVSALLFAHGWSEERWINNFRRTLLRNELVVWILFSASITVTPLKPHSFHDRNS